MRSRYMRDLKLLACCLLIVLSFFGREAAADESNLQAQFAATDKALLVELIALAKFNVHFHLEANRHQKWRQITYPLGRESGTALTFAATLIDIRQQVRGLDDPRRIQRNELKKAVACGITGNAISGGSSAMELAQNCWVMMKAKQSGYSPAQSLAFVKDIVSKTDRLLDQRDVLAEQVPSDDMKTVRKLETKLVRRIRQQLLFEFTTWSAHSRDRAWRENTFYFLDSGQNFTRMTAGILARGAFDRPKLARPSVICALVANSVATINPIVRNVTGMALRKYQERKLGKEIPTERPAADLDGLQATLAFSSDRPSDSLQRIARLTSRTEALDAELNREVKEIDRYRQIAQQQSISGPLIGLTGVTSSTLATVAVFGYQDDIETATRLGLAGRITQGTGQAYALLNTPYTVVKGMIRNHHLRERGALPTQILEARLKLLEELERQSSSK
jgi:hypothetical protein